MKQTLISFLLFLILPTLSWAEHDSCSYPTQYTIDKRCYVTEAQKKQKPYNAVVALSDIEFNAGNPIYCTGTIVKYDGKLYLYTARHCVVWKSEIPDSKLEMITQDGKHIVVNKNNIGNNDNPDSGDWAIYSIPNEYKNLAFAEVSDKLKIGFKDVAVRYDARIIGYGGLKVMSDAEISAFQQRYKKYLQKHDALAAFDEDHFSGTRYHPSNFIDYLRTEDNTFYLDVFKDSAKLKESQCKYLSSGLASGCQVWGGNSGGGVFDSDGKLMAIARSGNYEIAGANHAGLAKNVAVIGNKSIKPATKK